MLILVTLDNVDMHKASPYIHPNPTDGIITVRSYSTISSWTLFDMQGKALMAGTPDTKEVRIDLSNLHSSVYFLKIRYIDAESVGLPVMKRSASEAPLELRFLQSATMTACRVFFG